jgi:hypothetical protein
MKRILIAMMITLIAATAANASDVGVSVSIGQPGFYMNIGNVPPPAVYAHPVVVRPAPVVVYRTAPVVVARPVYAHVPPGHAKHWYRDHHGYPVHYGHDGRYYR